MLFTAEKVDCGPFRELIGDLAEKLVSTVCRRLERAHEIAIHKLKGLIDGGVSGFLELSQLMTFPTAQAPMSAIESGNATPLPFLLSMFSRLRLLR